MSVGFGKRLSGEFLVDIFGTWRCVYRDGIDDLVASVLRLGSACFILKNVCISSIEELERSSKRVKSKRDENDELIHFMGVALGLREPKLVIRI